MALVEINFDGIVGPSHNYAGLSLGNIASASHKGNTSYPRAAALQGARMRLARACHARSGPGPGAGGDDGGTCGFDPGDHAAFAGAAAPIHGGFPAGQRRS